MASIVRIKRSETAGNPTTLGQGELAYSALADNGSNGGDRLYIGMGTETSGNAVNHIVIGGKFFTDMLDHSKGVLTANSAIVTDSNNKIDNLKVDNIDINGNTISATDVNGDINITPNGLGKTVIGNIYTDATTSLAEYIQDITGGQIIDSSEIAATYNDTAGTTSLALKTTGVTAGSYGSASQIPTFTVDSKGRLTAAGTVSISTTLNIAGNTGTDAIALATDTLTINGSGAISTAVNASTNTLTISASDATTAAKGIASFDSNSFSVSSGAVSIKAGGVTNSQLVNSSFVLGTTTISLGSTASSVADLALTGVPTAPTATAGTNTTQIATTAFVNAAVDAARSGLDVKASVRVATTANITLSAVQTIDGVTLVAGDRVLVKDQTTASQNGIYVVSASAWTRATDADTSAKVTSGMFTFVEEGTTNADSGWVLTTNNPITLDTTSLAFAQFSGAGQITAGNGLTKTGNTLNVGAGTGIVANADDIALTGQALAFHNLATNGIVARTAAGTVAARTITGTTNRITVTNGDGVAGNPTLDIASTYAGQSTITTLGTVTTGVWNATTIATTYGGTGLTTYTTGDMIYASGTNTLAKLAAGADGKVLQMNASGVPTWGDIDGGTY